MKKIAAGPVQNGPILGSRIDNINSMTRQCLLKTFPKLPLYPDMNSFLQNT